MLAESVCTVCYCIQLFLMAQHIAIQTSRVHSFIYLWCTFMYLDVTLVILTVCKMKPCAAENVTMCVALDGANGGECRQCLEPL